MMVIALPFFLLMATALVINWRWTVTIILAITLLSICRVLVEE